MKNIDFKKLLPYVAAVLVFVVLTLIYFSPITDGYELKQDDVDNYKGMAKEVQDYRKQYGEDPLWTNSMFGGMPAYQIDVEHKGNLLFYIDNILMLGFPGVIGYFFLLFIGFYILLLCLKVDPWLSIVGAVAYAFSTYFILIVGVGHNTKVHALAYMPAVLGGFFVVMRGRMYLGTAIFTLFFALQLYSNHLQITYYLFILMLCIGIVELINVFVEKKNKKEFFTRVSLLIIGALFGILANTNNLWSTYDYAKETTRGPSELRFGGDGKIAEADAGLDAKYITAWSYGKDETWNLIFPEAKGGAGGYIGSVESFATSKSVKPEVKRFVQEQAMTYQESQAQQGYIFNKYWGNQPGTGGPTYIGAIVVFLFVVSFVFVQDKMKWGILAASILAVMLAWGHNFMGFSQFFIDHFPGYNKFRSVTMILVIVQLAMPLMAVLLVKEIIQNPSSFKNQEKKFLITSGITFGFLLLVVAMPKLFMSFSSASDLEFLASVPDANLADEVRNQIESFRVGVFRSDAFRSLLFIALAFAAIYAFIRNILNKTLVIALVGILILADLFLIDREYLNTEKYKGEYISWIKKGTYPYTPSQADVNILESEIQLNPNVLKDAEKFSAQIPTTGNPRDRQMAQLIDAYFPALNFNSNYRVLELGNPFNSSAASYFHKSIGGYHGAKLKRYQELIEFAIQREHNLVMNIFSQMMQSGIPADKLGQVYPMTGAASQTHVLNMLNARYLILNPNLPAIPNPGAAGQAWFVNGINWVDNSEEEILAVSNLVISDTVEKEVEGVKGKYLVYTSTSNNIVDTVVIDKRYESLVKTKNPVADSSAVIKMTYYSPRQITYETNNPKPGFAVFSEIYYNKGWKAKLDGKEVDYVRVNYVLRGMDIPADKHQIEFVFEPESFKTMQTVNMLGNILLLLIVAAFVYFDYKKNKIQKV